MYYLHRYINLYSAPENSLTHDLLLATILSLTLKAVTMSDPLFNLSIREQLCLFEVCTADSENDADLTLIKFKMEERLKVAL